MLVLADGADPSPAVIVSDHRNEAGPPDPNRLIADVDPALVERVLHIPRRQGIADVVSPHTEPPRELSNQRNGLGGERR